MSAEQYRVASQAARRVHRRFARYTTLDDLTQEAVIMATTNPDLLRHVEGEEPNYALLQYELERDLMNLCGPMLRRGERTTSLDQIFDAMDEGDDVGPAYVPLPTAGNDYTRESVEALLPAVWDESYSYGLPRKATAPDPGMPKGSTNKATGNDLSAYIADIKTGWEKTPLTSKERIALLLFYGMGWTQQSIAFNQGISQQTIQQRIDAAVGKIVARLNAGFWYELEGVAA